MPTDTLRRHFPEGSRIDSPADELRAGATIDIGHCGICGKRITIELADEHTIVETMRHNLLCPLARPMWNIYNTPHCVVSYDTRSLCTSGTIHDAYLKLYELNEGNRRRKPLWEDAPDVPDEPCLSDGDNQYSACDQYGNTIAYSPDTREEDPLDDYTIDLSLD